MGSPQKPNFDSNCSEHSSDISEQEEALHGYLFNPKSYPNNASNLKKTADGKYVLISQPTDLAQDPLNWSKAKKTCTIAVIAYVAFLADFGGGAAIITVIPQALEWDISQVAAQRAVVGNIFAIGTCGLIFTVLANYFGRLPPLVLFQLFMLLTCAWSAAATSPVSFLAARILNGFVCSVGQGCALIWVKDLFFFHEHPHVINYVESAIICSPYLGPQLAAFIISGTSWRWAFWLCTVLSSIALILVLLLDETLFDRTTIVACDKVRSPRWRRLVGSEQAKTFKHRNFAQCLARPVVALTKIPILLILIYYFLNFAWVIGVNTTVSIWLTNFYGFTAKDIGFFYFFGLVGVLGGWLIGHWLHDAVGTYYATRNNGRIDPEARLIVTYPATILLAVCLLVLGFAIQRTWHYMILAAFCALQCLAVMVVTTAINAYLLDCYPEGSGEVGAWITASRNWAGFMATFIQIEWVTKTGAEKAFGIQAAITLMSMLLILVLQWKGKAIRQRQGRIDFKIKSSTI